MSIGMSNLPTAFGCTVTKKIDRMFIQKLQIGMLINNIGSYFPFYAQCAVINSCIDFHATCVYHRTEQGILRQIMM